MCKIICLFCCSKEIPRIFCSNLIFSFREGGLFWIPSHSPAPDRHINTYFRDMREICAKWNSSFVCKICWWDSSNKDKRWPTLKEEQEEFWPLPALVCSNSWPPYDDPQGSSSHPTSPPPYSGSRLATLHHPASAVQHFPSRKRGFKGTVAWDGF